LEKIPVKVGSLGRPINAIMHGVDIVSRNYGKKFEKVLGPELDHVLGSIERHIILDNANSGNPAVKFVQDTIGWGENLWNQGVDYAQDWWNNLRG